MSIKLGNTDAKHQFEITAEKNQMVITIIVDANTRSQASNIVKMSGYVVHDVNMIG